MRKQIRTVGYRNGIFVGQIAQSSKSYQNPQGIGLILDDMFLGCLSSWWGTNSQSIKPSGPTLILYPHRQIFYCEHYPQGNKLEGFWAFLNSRLKIYGSGESGILAILQPGGNTLSRVRSKAGTPIQSTQDTSYNGEQQKWQKIEQTIGARIDPCNRSIQKFIETNFMARLDKQQSKQNFISTRGQRKKQQMYGIMGNNEGIAFALNNDHQQVEVNSLGFYREFEPYRSMALGRRYIDELNSSSYRIEEGDLLNQDIFSFEFSESRPAESYKTCRKYFRQMTTFCNRFLQLSEADYVYNKLVALEKEYIVKIGSKYGQKIIEGEYQPRPSEQDTAELGTYRSQRYKQQIQANRQYNLQQAKAKIQHEITRKKTAGLTGRHTGAFSSHIHLSKEKQKERTHAKSPNRDSVQSSPILSYSQQQPQKGSRKSPLKYCYTEREDTPNYQPTVAEWRKQSKRYGMGETKAVTSPAGPPKGASKRVSVGRAVNEFTLYPIIMEESEPAARARDNESRARDWDQIRNQEKERILREVEYQLQKERELQLKLLQIQEKENERRLLEDMAGGKNQTAMTAANPYYQILQQRNAHYPSLYAGSLPLGFYHQNHGSAAAFRGRFFPSYNYTEHPGGGKQKSATPARNAIQAKPSLSPSPVNRLRLMGEGEGAEKGKELQKQMSKSPIGRRGKVPARVYTYVD